MVIISCEIFPQTVMKMLDVGSFFEYGSVRSPGLCFEYFVRDY